MSNEENKITGLFQRLMSYEGPKIVKDYEGASECLTHGKYIVHITEYDNGTRIEEPNRCPVCEKERIEEARKRTQERIHQELIEQYKASNVSSEYFEKDFEDFVVTTKAQKVALESVKKLVEDGHGKIIMIGSNGVGKTLLGSIAVKKLGGYIYTMYEIATRIRQSYAAGSKETELEIVNDLIDAPLLVIDEVGRVKMSEAVQDWFSYIIDQRHTRNKPFILNGNLHFKEFCENKDNGGCQECFENIFDTDVLSRLRDATIIEILAKDNRSRNESSCFVTDRGGN